MTVIIKKENEWLSLEEVEENKELIEQKTKDWLKYLFQKVEPEENKELEITAIGIEIEGVITDKEFKQVPMYDKISKHSKHIHHELLKSNFEIRTDPIKYPVNKSSLKKEIDFLIEEVEKGAEKENLNAFFVGGYPCFDNKRKVNEINTRYAQLVKNIDSLKTNDIEIPLINETLKDSGTIWEGYGTSVQINFKVPHESAGYYHDASNMIQPLILALTTSSPFIDGKLTKFQSTRMKLIPQAVYGRKEKGKKSLMRLAEFNLTQDDKEYNKEIYELLKSLNASEPVAKYVAFMSKDNHITFNKNDLENTDFKIWKSPYINWPHTKIKYDSLMDDKGIVIEIRIGEQPGTKNLTNFILTTLSMIQAVAEDLKNKKYNPLAPKLNQENLDLATEGKKEFFWLNKKSSLREIFAYLTQRAKEVMQKQNYNIKSIENILNPLINKAGLELKNNNLSNIEYQLTLSEQMIQEAVKNQPGIKNGEKLTKDTMVKIMGICK